MATTKKNKPDRSPITDAIVHGKVIEAVNPSTGEIYQFTHLPLVSGKTGNGLWIARNTDEQHSHVIEQSRVQDIVTSWHPDVRTLTEWQSVFNDG